MNYEYFGLVVGVVVMVTASINTVAPPLTALFVAYCLGYLLLRETDLYAQHFNLLMISSLLILVLNTITGPFGLLAIFWGSGMAALGEMGVVLGVLKLIFAIPGKSIKGQFVTAKGATAAAAAQQSLWTAVTSVLNPQAVLAFIAALFAIIPLVILDILLNQGSHTVLAEIFVIMGVISLSLIAIALDTKDRAIRVASKLKQAFASTSESQKQAGRNQTDIEAARADFARNFYKELDEDLPEKANSAWTETQIQSLSAEEFRTLCFKSAKQECKEEGGRFDIKDSSSDFGKIGVAELPNHVVGVLIWIPESQPNISSELLLSTVWEAMEALDPLPDFVQLYVPEEIDDGEQIELLQEFGLVTVDVSLLCREFEDNDIRPTSA
ncbi:MULTISPECIES: hypothetical protein [Haloarcula]|uniref:hypothetical protein n=1 Tax=Haloarcula TaxID=2237 RepID=UPI0023EE1C33|nr:hypothetical protein [Halomicroarcula sp. XH51]